ncbi:MAG: hypothetical protein FGM24_06460 [Candidatus Kapabacteria bacterium]|nr:hypothetical protein [Candidatus Kapabacteria bacterium]
MFEAELERVRKQLKQQLATTQPYVSIAELLANVQVHPTIRTFFRAEVDWWVHEERAIRSSNPRFATTDAAFADVLRTLDGLYVRHARFDHEELSATIDAAAKTWLNYLCRPRVTLRWFVFRGEPTKPLHEILLRLQYLTDYPYLLEGFRQWATLRSSDTSGFEILSVIEFERIIEKIDNDAILDMSQSQFVALLDPLFAFFAQFDPDLPPESVPTEAVIIFLDDKGAVPISQVLERMLYREDMRTLTRSKLVDVIDGVLASLDVDDQSASAVFPEEEPVAVQTQPMPAIERLESVVVAAEIPMQVEPPVEDAPSVDVELPAATALVHDGAAATIEIAPPDETIKTEHPVDVIETEPAVDAVKTEPAVDTSAETPAVVQEAEARAVAEAEPDDRSKQDRRQRLETLIDERLRERVVKRMLGRNAERYHEIVRIVEDCATWKEAAGVLDRYYAQHGIEPNSATAIEFSQAVYRSFTLGTS